MSAKKRMHEETRGNKSNESILLDDDAPFGMVEAYNALCTKIIFSLPNTSSAVIGITSSSRHEGKSYTSINLAISFSKIGKKVLIIDGDMRLPTVALKIGIPGFPGLSNCLVGLTEVRDCLYKDICGGIDVLPAGKVPPSPTRLLQSGRMLEILQSAREHYDYIIIDLPPINTVTDAALISQVLDGYLLVVRHRQTEYKQIDAMLRELMLVNAKVLGFVYNDVPGDKKAYYKNYR